MGGIRAGALVAALTLTLPLATADAKRAPEIRTLSNRADLISGGDALIQVTLPKKASKLKVRVNGRNVTRLLTTRRGGRARGVITGLRIGENRVAARAGRARSAELTITNHPVGGPVFAGPQVQPWTCTTEEAGLGEPTDPQCNAPTKVTYVYKSTGGGALQPYDPADPPTDVAQTTTDQGKTVPFVVRVEMGTQDRGIYRTAVLARPADDLRRLPGWNHKLFVPFGGGCAALYRQTVPEGTPDEFALARGFMVTASGLNTLNQNCNEAVSAEALMMQKEHIVEQFGAIRYTMGTGGSGGAIQQYDIAAAYPGLLDGIMPSASFADVVTTEAEVVDCGLLNNYYLNTSPHLWANGAQRAAAEGHANVGSSCAAWTALFLPAGDPQGRGPFGLPVQALDCGVPADQKYHPQNNPEGVRCDIGTYQGSIYGYRPDGLARRPVDNVGIQYGLDALNAGLISTEQFVDLNEKIGGYDMDLEPMPERMRADPRSLPIAYRTARVADARQLAKVPIIDLRGQDNEEIHQSYYSYTVRARLDAANGTHANQVIWTGAVPLAGDSTFATRAFIQMDRWLAAVEADRSRASLRRKVIENRPPGLGDACYLEGHQVVDQNSCRQLFPYYSNPRIAAGAPFSNDVLKCRQRPLDRSAYEITFSDAQWDRLTEVFPGGVCDYRRPGVGQQRSRPWMTFADGPGGRPLGAAPRSRPLTNKPA
ncbi:MAG TPA: DUF6351 family protein [Thermoleophilaceae bacterium]|nr:DUF6351 family protein [Thermoleophilaceae bacterium]